MQRRTRSMRENVNDYGTYIPRTSILLNTTKPLQDRHYTTIALCRVSDTTQHNDLTEHKTIKNKDVLKHFKLVLERKTKQDEQVSTSNCNFSCHCLGRRHSSTSTIFYVFGIQQCHTYTTTDNATNDRRTLEAM